LLASQVSLTDRIAAARIFASGLFAQAEIKSDVGDFGPQEAKPTENSVTAPKPQDEPTSPLHADQPPLTLPESTGALSPAPLPVLQRQSFPGKSDADPTLTAPTPSATLAIPALSAADIAALVARGDDLLRRKDIVSALLFYQRAAEAGDKQAALWMMRATSDPRFFDSVGAGGVSRNSGKDRFLYRTGGDGGVATGKRGSENQEARSQEQQLR
jgi:hypothetical protein